MDSLNNISATPAHATAGAAPPLAERIAAALGERERNGLMRSLHARTASPHTSGAAAAHAAAALGNSTDEKKRAHTPAEIPTEQSAERHNWRDLSGNDYLRLASHPDVIAVAVSALRTWGASSSASPLISGYTEAHRQLEQRLCAWSGFEHALVWNTGYAANQAVLSTLPQRGDIVLADRLIHNSMITGLVRSGARLQRYRHCDCAHLTALLEQYANRGRSVFVVTESVFSMDGDYPDLRAIAKLKERYSFSLIVDEAHALGWYGARGSGLIEQTQTAAAVDVVVGTLGKGLGSMGAYTLFHNAELRDYLINFAGEFIYSTYLPPSCAAAAAAAIHLIETKGAEERTRLHVLSSAIRAQLPHAPQGDSPIVPLLVGDTTKALATAQRLRSKGICVGCVRPPTVPDGSSRLRLSLHAELSQQNIAELAAAIKEALQ